MRDFEAPLPTRPSRRPKGILRDERGATAIEYALIVGLIFLAIVVSVGATGTGLSAAWVSMAGNATSHLKTVD